MDATKLLTAVDGALTALEAAAANSAKVLAASNGNAALALDSCKTLAELFETNRQTHLAVCADSDAALSALQQKLLEAKASVNARLVSRLRVVSAWQSQIREVNSRITSLREASVAQETAVAELTHVEAMPTAYRAALCEVVRRRTFEKLYVAEVEAAADSLSRLRSSEIHARETFLRRHGRHLPKVTLACVASFVCLSLMGCMTCVFGLPCAESDPWAE